jgi:hypothetical protein
MTLDELLAALDHKSPPAPTDALNRFEAKIGQQLPDDYREFLVRCNGGYGCGYVQFHGPTPEGHAADACMNHVGGFREESYFSLESSYKNYQEYEVRIPRDLIPIFRTRVRELYSPFRCSIKKPSVESSLGATG